MGGFGSRRRITSEEASGFSSPTVAYVIRESVRNYSSLIVPDLPFVVDYLLVVE